ncbi:MAG: helix-hairpin-helix domain-containing protein [Myxococcota bacterium]
MPRPKPRPTSPEHRAALTALRTLPAIGPSLAQDLWLLGYRAPPDLVGADPMEMYRRLEALSGSTQDPCVLDTFRCAVYAASTPEPDPARLEWWWWSRQRLAGELPGHR